MQRSQTGERAVRTYAPSRTYPFQDVPRTLLLFVAVLAIPSIAGAGSGGKWSPLAPMQTPRQEAGAVCVNNVVYVVGGLTGTPGNPSATATVEAYDIAGDEWTFVTDMPEPRDHHACAVLLGNVYVAGGYQVATVPFDDVFVYNPILDSWSTGTPLPSARGAGTMVELDGRLYHFGGVGPVTVTSTTYVYDPILGWFEAAPMPTPREHTNAVVVGEHIYVIGGRSGPSTDANERYHPATDSWESRASMPTSRSAMVVAVYDGKIHCAGGEVPQLFSVHEVYDPAGNAWECREPMAIPRHGVGTAVLDDRFMVPGGGTIQGFQPTNQVDAFVPDPVPIDGYWLDAPLAPGALRLGPPAPNPFGALTRIGFALADPNAVSLRVHDVAGRLVRTLLDAERLDAGVHHLTWRGHDDAGRALPAGVYFLTLLAGERVEARRVIRLG